MPRKLGRPTAHRMAMLQTMVTTALDKGRLETTYTRAQEVAPLVEKMITLGKLGTLAARRQAMAFMTSEDAVRKLFEEIAKRYESRQGGYTRVTRIGFRRGDAAEVAVLELVEG
jgi:large subunit ribosomal protein L17